MMTKTKTIALVGLSALGLLSFASQASADKFQVSDTVQENWNRYLGKITSTNSGAFAVSLDGYTSYYIYCQSSQACGSAAEAIKECERESKISCKLVAKGKDPLFEIEVVETSRAMAGDDPIKAGILDGDGLRQKIVGNTSSGHYLNGIKWAEYYSPDGKIIGFDDIRGSYEADYEIDGNRVCYSYSDGGDWCASISLIGENVEYIDEDNKHQAGIQETKLIAGNAVKSQ